MAAATDPVARIPTELGAKTRLAWHVLDICFLQSGFTSAALLSFAIVKRGSGGIVAQHTLFIA